MNDFDYDCVQRKNLAKQARYRKRGAKSKKCSLPSDGMTQKQWKERNGAIMSVNLRAPISWQEFKALSPSLMQEYVGYLSDNYNINTNSLS